MQNKQAPGYPLSKHNMELHYLSARAGAYGRCGATHILNLHPAGQNPKTLGNLLVTDPPGRVLTERERETREVRKSKEKTLVNMKRANRGKLNKTRCPGRLLSIF